MRAELIIFLFFIFILQYDEIYQTYGFLHLW